MNRHQTAAPLHELDHRSLLLRGDARPVRINGQRVIACQLLRGQILQLVRVNQIDPFLRQDRLQLLESIGRTVMPLITEEQDSQRGGGVSRTDRRTKRGPQQHGGQTNKPPTIIEPFHGYS